MLDHNLECSCKGRPSLGSACICSLFLACFAFVQVAILADELIGDILYHKLIWIFVNSALAARVGRSALDNPLSFLFGSDCLLVLFFLVAIVAHEQRKKLKSYLILRFAQKISIYTARLNNISCAKLAWVFMERLVDKPIRTAY